MLLREIGKVNFAFFSQKTTKLSKILHIIYVRNLKTRRCQCMATVSCLLWCWTGNGEASYGLKITEAYHIFDKTIKIYCNAVHYISDIAIRHYDELKSLESITGDDGKVIISAQQRRQQKMERLINSTASNDAVYKRFDKEFYLLGHRKPHPTK